MQYPVDKYDIFWHALISSLQRMKWRFKIANLFYEVSSISLCVDTSIIVTFCLRGYHLPRTISLLSA